MTVTPTDHDLWREFFADEEYVRLVSSILSDGRTTAEVAGLLALLGPVVGQRVLDLGCGQGRIAVPLATAGARVTGWDGCAPLLTTAAEAARRAGVELDLVRADMIELDRVGEFDVAFNVGKAFGYGSEEADRATLTAVRRALTPTGVFVMDTENRERMLSAPRRTWFDRAGSVVCCERTFDAVSSRWRETLRWTDERQVARERSYALRLYTATELVEAMRRAGFRGAIEVFGGLDGSRYDLDSPRLVLRARST